MNHDDLKKSWLGLTRSLWKLPNNFFFHHHNKNRSYVVGICTKLNIDLLKWKIISKILTIFSGTLMFRIWALYCATNRFIWPLTILQCWNFFFPNTKLFGKFYFLALERKKKFSEQFSVRKILKITLFNSDLNLPPLLNLNLRIDMDAI